MFTATAIEGLLYGIGGEEGEDYGLMIMKRDIRQTLRNCLTDEIKMACIALDHASNSNYSNEINLTFISDEENFDALFNARAYKDEQGKIILVNAYLLKIIDRKKYEAELLLAKRMAEESLNSAKKIIDENNEQFIKIAMNQSHMIRRPLANMLGLLAILKDIKMPDEGENLIRLLELSAEELDTLIKEVVKQTRQPE